MLSDSEAQKISKFLSLILRHKPDEIGITLDGNGWTDVDTLLQKLTKRNLSVRLDDLKYIVETNSKKRFALSDDFTRIRANQGHSVEVDLGYTEKQPPRILYHGTTTRFLTSILTEGLKKMNRHHVHLSADEDTARNVGSRHGKPMVLTIESGDMAADGVFYQSDNGVWLTDHVPAAYIINE